MVLTLHLQTRLFGRLKQSLRGRRFTTDQQLDVKVHACLVSQVKTFYSGHKADRAVMDRVHCKARGLC
jgi:hypothetical protein